MAQPYKTPGVYIEEQSAFPNAIIGVPTALPAFVGYTQQAVQNEKNVANMAIKISSLAEFETIFGSGPTTTCNIVAQTQTTNCDFVANGTGYNLELTAGTVYNLYNSIQLFYANGGGTCCIVSVGGYDKPVSATDIVNGLNVLNNLTGPTLLVVPDAVLLPTAGDYATVCNAMINQGATLKDRMAILDVYNGATPFAANNTNLAIDAFRQLLNASNLSYGAAYFPFLNTTINTATTISYTQFLPADLLTQILTPQLNIPFAQLQSQYNTAQLSQYLQSNVLVYQQMVNVLLAKLNVLPPSAAMAGVYTATDNAQGVWVAPANVALSSVAGPTVAINDAQQGLMNIDPVSGKSVNAIRAFTGQGTLVWGARTLDGNSQDYRYVSVRRTLIYIEQTLKNITGAYVFAPNDGNTWMAVKENIAAFLNGLWQQGGLMGPKAGDAFNVYVGLGSTMTAIDILNGYMFVQVEVALVRPAEFIELAFQQQMQGA